MKNSELDGLLAETLRREAEGLLYRAPTEAEKEMALLAAEASRRGLPRERFETPAGRVAWGRALPLAACALWLAAAVLSVAASAGLAPAGSLASRLDSSLPERPDLALLSFLEACDQAQGQSPSDR